jgi:hypothetical protein
VIAGGGSPCVNSSSAHALATDGTDAPARDRRKYRYRIGADPARHPPLSQSEEDFLHASDRAHRRGLRQRQSFTAFLMVLVVGFAAVAVVAFRANQATAHQRDVAVSGQLISKSEALGDTDPVISKLESITAWRLNPSAEARYAMLAAAALPPDVCHAPQQLTITSSPMASLPGRATANLAPNAKPSATRR